MSLLSFNEECSFRFKLIKFIAIFTAFDDFHNLEILNLQKSKDITLSNKFSEFIQRKMEINCWPELAANYGANFESYLQQKLFSDVTLIARDRNGHGMKFPVHRFVLASALTYVSLS